MLYVVVVISGINFKCGLRDVQFDDGLCGAKNIVTFYLCLFFEVKSNRKVVSCSLTGHVSPFIALLVRLALSEGAILYN